MAEQVVKRPGLYILFKTYTPAVLLAYCFISHEGDVALFHHHMEQVSKRIAQGVANYFAA